jgi:hypothetical protein
VLKGIRLVFFFCIIIGPTLLPLANAQNETSWDRTTYPPNSSGTVEIIDKDLSLNPMTITTFQTSVWSDSDLSGIKLQMVETAPNSGIFLGNVYFSTSSPSSGNRLHVSEGDTVTAEYIDRTLPPPYLATQQLIFRATALIASSSSGYLSANNLSAICGYSLNGHLLYGSNSCPLLGDPTILSQAKQLAPDVIKYLLDTDEEYYSLMLNHYKCTSCSLDVSKLCQYDQNGNLIPSFTVGQEKVLLDLQANFSFNICPFMTKPSVMVQSNATGTTGTFHLILDRLVYSPGETVTIHVESTNTSTNIPVSLKILDATTNIKGTYTIFEDTQKISNGGATFNYIIPQEASNQTPYRYLVQVFQDKQDCCPLGSAYFVTMPEATQFSISNVQVLTLKVSPGEAINFTAFVRDGLGTVVRNLDVQADLPQSNSLHYLSGNATLDNSTQLYVGKISVPKSFDASSLPLQYYLRVTVQGPAGMGFTPAEFRGGIVNLVPITIPEFPFALPVLVISFLSLTVFYKTKK